VRSGRDLVALTEDEWRAMLRGAIPDADPGSVNARLALIHSRLHVRYPTAFVAETVTTPRELDPALLRRVLHAHPHLLIARHPPRPRPLPQPPSGSSAGRLSRRVGRVVSELARSAAP